ncbi:FkbM family methyltransferase [Dolichospermum circinale]|uniref:FkbM family methyltransferase n=2 Tax=Dolichospermum circinale TaxID=109265 RepID=UPI00232FBD36|nr:FkbM family methyltransferase [Dolichospermum circinale]MDB9549171.1 FkbM family methyltransferase [Dolichospermum circinale CS-1031]
MSSLSNNRSLSKSKMLDIKQRIRDIKHLKFNSSFLRNLLSLYYKEGKSYRMIFGQLRGLKLFYDRQINYHAILGLWDTETFEILSKVFETLNLKNKKMTVYDIGANIGIYSLWFAKNLSQDSVIYSFEPSPQVKDKLKSNIELNFFNNIDVVELACSDQVGNVEFFIASHHHCSSLNQEWAAGSDKDINMTEKIVVKCTTLDDFCYGQEPHKIPDFIKMDIEGGGVFALKGCDRCINESQPILLVESHIPDEDKAISDLVVRHNYQAYRLNNRKWVTEIHDTFPNPEGIWGTLLLVPNKFKQLLVEILP